ncbi:MAG: CBS domain-containing protein [Desulfobacteraceae bacterium]|nr:CBS domain-containing protein [Desulfobacteraceae bacterium]
MKTAEDILKDKPRSPKICVSPKHSLAAAIDKMNQAKIGAILIEQNDEIVGIWTERDLLKAMSNPGFDIQNEIIGGHMTTKLYCASHDTPVIKMQEMFLGLYIRHIVIKKQDRFIGLLSIGDVMRASLLEKEKELKKLNKIASWQYYENWGWDRKKT